LPPDGGNCEEVLASFAQAGIDVMAVAAQLQEDGAKAFSKSWNELLAGIAAKTAEIKKAG
jgi:transaldolase